MSISALQIRSNLQNGPLKNVPKEILSQIFTLSTYDSSWHEPIEPSMGYNPLVTAMSMSQVCITWRELLNRSPTLWGRLMDTSYVCNNLEWWEHVFCKSGNVSDLYLRHRDRHDKCTARILEQFILPILSTSASRVARIHVDTTSSTQWDKSDPNWSSLGRLGNLRILRLGTLVRIRFTAEGTMHHHVDHHIGQHLHKCTMTEQYTSMRQLRVLYLEGNTQPFGEILQLLRHTPVLEQLHLINITNMGSNFQALYRFQDIAPVDDLNLIALPYLEMIKVKNMTLAAIMLLPRIEPPSKFRKRVLSITGVICDEDMIASQVPLHAWVQAISMFSRSLALNMQRIHEDVQYCFEKACSMVYQRCGMEFTPTTLTFHIGNMSSGLCLAAGHELATVLFSIVGKCAVLQQVAALMLPHIIHHTHLHNVDLMVLDICEHYHDVIVSPIFRDFIHGASSLKKLMVNCQALQIINNNKITLHPKELQILQFPELMHVTYVIDDIFPEFSDLTALKIFSKAQAHMNRPLHQLSFMLRSGCDSWHIKQTELEKLYRQSFPRSLTHKLIVDVKVCH